MSKERVIPAGRNGTPPTHPDEILKEMYLDPLGLSINKLATRMQVTTTRVNDVVRGPRGITADTVFRLGKVFSTLPQLWLNLKKHL